MVHTTFPIFFESKNVTRDNCRAHMNRGIYELFNVILFVSL